MLDQTTIDVGNKEEVFCCKGGQNKGTTLVLAVEELENNTLKRNMSQFGEPGSGSDNENNMSGMMIVQSKKDEVSVLSAPTQSTFVSFDNSVFNSLGKGVQSVSKLQSKGVHRIFGLVVRDKFMPDCKFCNDKICEQIVTKCIARNEMVQTPGEWFPN